MSENLTLTWTDNSASKTDNAAGHFTLAKRFDSISIQLRAGAISADYAARMPTYYVGIFPGVTEPSPSGVTGMKTTGWSNNARTSSEGALRTFTADSNGNPFRPGKYWIIVKWSGDSSLQATNSGTITVMSFSGEPHGAPSVLVKTDAATWSEIEGMYAKSDAATWAEVTALQVKTDAATWEEADG